MNARLASPRLASLVAVVGLIGCREGPASPDLGGVAAKGLDAACSPSGGLVWCPGEDVGVAAGTKSESIAIAGTGIASTERERLEGTFTWNEQGETSVVASVDDDAWLAKLEDYDRRLAELGEEYAEAAAAYPSSSGASLDAEVVDVEAYGSDAGETQVRTSWNMVDCGAGYGGEGIDIVYYGAYTADPVDDPMNARQRKVVYIRESDEDGRCTGTLVDSDTVLTAAHCLWDFDAGAATSASFNVCDYGNSEYNGSALTDADVDCATATAVVPLGYKVFGDFGSDFALLQLSDPFENDGWMAMWSGSFEETMSHYQYNVGYPQAAGEYCQWPARDTSPVDGAEPGFTSVGGAAYQSSAVATAYTAALIKTRNVASPGMSGGPIYFFPYSGSTAHYVSGVLDGYASDNSGAVLWVGGANVSTFRNWVIANM